MEQFNGCRVNTHESLWAGLKFHSLSFAPTMEADVALNALSFLYLVQVRNYYLKMYNIL